MLSRKVIAGLKFRYGKNALLMNMQSICLINPHCWTPFKAKGPKSQPEVINWLYFTNVPWS